VKYSDEKGPRVREEREGIVVNQSEGGAKGWSAMGKTFREAWASPQFTGGEARRGCGIEGGGALSV